MKLRVGIVGLGDAWESRHRPALRALSDRFEIRAFCAEVAHKAEIAAKEFNASPLDGFRSLAAREDVDAVLMLAPAWYGPAPILAACDAGKAIYCSAALDIEPRHASRIKERVEASGVAFMAEFPRRHAPATLRLKELIATRLGRPQLLFCHERLRKEETGPNGTRRYQPFSSATRELMELADWCRYVVDQEPTSVMGVEHDTDGNDKDYQMLSLDFSPEDRPGRGPLAQISCGRYLPRSWRDAISFRAPSALQVVCERGAAFVDLPSQVIWFDEAGQHIESLESERPVGEQLLTQFHRAVTSLVRKISDLEDAYRALHVVLAAQTSCQEGRRVPLDF
ncbi:Gfo/Idh/MocA family protein [Lignipirellula cremea]|uniref:Inositol 2-dehydrogenase/D-chiro-inositol 3-dehydrogenase n=1 Tax=Lignipirellula cremea TaxID=2528010 RepID=A0A518DX72_9BACT|nr:Gfo/Idh/MocA family oxidoreductase [Lignipirellula cremea]QDU96461.1 Inositol 2-dehydrogenase/D-chiro-inositol 3-dehydrogenase [Lignipirellula cremea]